MNTTAVSSAAWPQGWNRGVPKGVTIALIAMSVVAGAAFVFGIAGIAGIPLGLWFFSVAGVTATSLPTQRPDRVSDRVRMTSLDPRTGAIDVPGGLPGVLVTEHPGAPKYFAALVTLQVLTGPAAWLAVGSDLGFPPYMAWFGAAMSVYGVYLTVMFLIRKGPGRLVLTERGFWVNNASSYAFVPWSDVRSVLPVRRGRANVVVVQLTPTATPIVGTYFGFTHEPVVRRGAVGIAARWFDLDAALLLYTLQFAADPAYRWKLATGAALQDMRDSYSAVPALH